MRFGIFYEHQNPRPWRAPRSEHQLLSDALEQVELADRVGFDYVFTGRFDVGGDLALATRVPEMFGAAPRF